MPFENGTFAFSAFTCPKTLPSNSEILELLSAFKAKKLDNLSDEIEIGWCGCHHLLDIDLNEGNTFLGRYPFFQLRSAVRSVPASLLKSECRMYEQNFMKESGFERVSQAKKKEIREDVIRRRLPSMPPSLSGVQVAIDRVNNYIYFSTSSIKQQQVFVQLFQKTFDCEIRIVNVAELMYRKLKCAATDLPPLKLENSAEVTDYPGRDFLTWLWYFSESEESSTFTIDKGAAVQISIDGPLVMTATFESSGSGETVLKKGVPTQSLEVKSALQVGKKLKKAKLLIAKEEAWTLTFDADKFAFSGVVLPEGDQMDANGRFDDRMERTFVLMSIIEALFEKYARIMTDEKSRQTLQKSMDSWIQSRPGL